MYTITLDDSLFFDPRVDGYPLGSPKLTREANKIGTLSFTLFPKHPAYNRVKMLTSMFAVRKDGRLIYQGRPAYSKRKFKGAIEYKCEEVTACMNDYKFRPVSFSGSADDLFREIITSYNNRTRGTRFAPGIIMSPADIELQTQYMGHWDALQEYFVKPYGGYIYPRYENGTIYLDWQREEDLPDASQVIRFGQNMTDMFIETDSNETYSGVIPLGKDGLTIESVNGGDDVIYNGDAVQLYGTRETTADFPEITDPSALMDAGYDWLRLNAIKFRQSVQISAIDLHNANYSVESFAYMHRVKAESTRHGLSERYLLSREEVPLDRPTGTVLTLGTTRRTFSDGGSV